ncbi:hypothetical protein Cni_G17815 [Canna indica]|uniref:GATA-type domain-containing protein n=1 Tax=Canna indica TaxID=4628 RepID=A0AAQ3KN37_9LILI|nr:hypothetical protein Cni_G17815 [Canna indica]
MTNKIKGEEDASSSRTRIMKKTMSSQDDDKPRANMGVEQVGFATSNCPIRACSNCNTTKTPLWRSGPHGPKSLCNACGIRQRKGRRAAMEAAGMINNINVHGVVLPSKNAPNYRLTKEKKPSSKCVVPFKKRCKFTGAGKQLFLDETGSKEELHFEKLGFREVVFPKDEKDAAMLLMGLSCSIIGS